MQDATCAEAVYVLSLLIVLMGLALGGIADLMLWLHGKSTVSDWLRINPEWFLIPLALVFVFSVYMAVHLFLQK